MDKCGCDDYASPIDSDIAHKDRKSYRENGPDETTQVLLDMIKAEPIEGVTLLDIGGGIGVIDHELLSGGAGSAVLVEASPDYLEAARAEAQDAELGDRLQIVEGDFVHRAASFQPADIVTLDRVMCCYPEADELIAASASRAKRLYGLVLPRDRWYVRWSTRAENVLFRLQRDAYRAFAHSNARIDEQLATAGLTMRSESFTLWWRVVLYERLDSERASTG